ncbi:hypothetical protein [Kosakonia sp. 1610]|uniref:hypothetical protein n=1 Tax=Kosakonia sp. 1610 TaxID=3156426 RepID=UPI003D1A116E
MARPKKPIQIPGNETETQQNAAEAAGVAIVSNSAPAFDPALTTDTGAISAAMAGLDVNAAAVVERNAVLSDMPVSAMQMLNVWDELGFVDSLGRPLTDNPEFLRLIKKAHTQPAMVTNSDGVKRPAPGRPQLTDKGWHVPG